MSEVTGQIILREAPTPVEIKAYISGKCVRELEKEGAVIETNAAYIQGIFGFGGETHGDLQVVVESPKDVLSADRVNESHKDKILVGGSLVTREALEKAIQVGAKGVVVGSIYDKDMTEFLGYEIGVAITGHEEVGTTVIITEGFGELNMAQRTFDILKSFDGYHASISGATQIRAGVMRPEIIIPHNLAFPSEKEFEEELASGMKTGTVVRIIREPYFGGIGQVSRLPVELQQIETLSKVRVLDVTLEDGRTVTVPRANVEIIEE